MTSSVPTGACDASPVGIRQGSSRETYYFLEEMVFIAHGRIKT